jgi:DNA-binding winged helix-turn-helix (wHTH) protein
VPSSAIASEAVMEEYFLVSSGGRRTAGGTSALEVRLLGPVQVVRAGREIAVGGPRQRAVLALLVLRAGQVVFAGQLVEEVWRGRPPPGAAKTLRSYVSRLRAVLEPEAGLTARRGGYVLGADSLMVDAGRFEELVAAGQAGLSRSDPAAAGSRFREALGLWRGQALADVREAEPLAREAARLEELRLVAVEGRIEADIATGLHAEAAGDTRRGGLPGAAAGPAARGQHARRGGERTGGSGAAVPGSRVGGARQARRRGGACRGG